MGQPVRHSSLSEYQNIIPKNHFEGTLAFGSISGQLLSLLGVLLFLFTKSRHPQVVVNRSGLKKCLGLLVKKSPASKSGLP